MQTLDWRGAFALRCAVAVLFLAAVSGRLAGEDQESPPNPQKVNRIAKPDPRLARVIVTFRNVRLEIGTVADDPAEDGAAARTLERQIRLAEGAFDEMLFGKVSNAADVRLRLERMAYARVESVNRICELTDAQKGKLQLACRGDIRRLFDSADDLRQQLESRCIDAADIRQIPELVDELSRQVQPLRARLNFGQFDDHSLFSKVLRHILTSEQVVKYYGQSGGRQAPP
jgi:hypothetical protein